jgi:hypothetical protein
VLLQIMHRRQLQLRQTPPHDRKVRLLACIYGPLSTQNPITLRCRDRFLRVVR